LCPIDDGLVSPDGVWDGESRRLILGDVEGDPLLGGFGAWIEMGSAEAMGICSSGGQTNTGGSICIVFRTGTSGALGNDETAASSMVVSMASSGKGISSSISE